MNQKIGRKRDPDERISTEAFLRDTAELCIVLVDEEMIIDVDEAFDTSATKRIHDLGEYKEGEKDKLDSKKSQTDDQGLDITNLRCERHVV